MENYSNIKTCDDYYNLLSSKKSFILQHLMKFYYYHDHKDKDDLSSANWTRQHWITEITDIIDYSNKKNFSNEEFNNISGLRLRECLVDRSVNSSTESFNKNVNLIKELMIELGLKRKYHELPIISYTTLRSKWTKFSVFYSCVMDRICDRLESYDSIIVPSVLRKILSKAVQMNTSNPDKLTDYLNSKNFSDDESDDWIPYRT